MRRSDQVRMQTDLRDYLERVLWSGNRLCDAILVSVVRVERVLHQHGAEVDVVTSAKDFRTGTGFGFDDEVFRRTVLQEFDGTICRRTWLISRGRELTDAQTYACADGFRYAECAPGDILGDFDKGIDFLDVFGFFSPSVGPCRFDGLRGAMVTSNDNEGMVYLRFRSEGDG